jgi:hypothetical protein
MKVRNVVTAIGLGIGIILVFMMVTAAIAVGEDRPKPTAPAIATAQIPFDFWIGDTHLAAGEYALYPVLNLNTLLLLRNTKTNAQEQAFLVPTGELVSSREYKMIFVAHTGEHYLQEIWDEEGKAVLTSQIGISITPADTRSEVPLIDRTTVKAAVASE